MGSDKGKRKRVYKKSSLDINNIDVVYDPIEFKPNCASENAQQIHVYDELKVELWCDKHYHIRRTLGDNNGKREGIEVSDVQELIIKGFKYLLDIHLRGIQFKFINFFDPNNPLKKLPRIVIQEQINDTVLNVVCEVHYLDTSKFEITVITAMVVEDFNISDGQYVLKINNDKAYLRRKIQKNIVDHYILNII